MPLTVLTTDKPGRAVFTEFDGPNGTGNVVPPVGKVTFASDHPEVATVDPDSGQLAYVAPGTANISASDAGANLAASDVLTVDAPPPPTPTAVSATLTLQPGS